MPSRKDIDSVPHSASDGKRGTRSETLVLLRVVEDVVVSLNSIAFAGIGYVVTQCDSTNSPLKLSL